MPKVPNATVTPPKKGRGGRSSIRQQEIMDALEALRDGEGVLVEDDMGNKFMCIALDGTKVPTLRSARAAFYNLRWKYHPKSGGDPERFASLFGESRGTVRIEEQNGEILIFVPATYVQKRVAATKRAEKVAV